MGAVARPCVGDYVVRKTLGAGATGKVKLAVHVETGARVALKVISKDLLARKPAVGAKVRREIAIMKLVAGCVAAVAEPDDVGVLGLLDVYDTEAHKVLVLQYCEGGELFDVLVRSGCLPMELVLDYFQQLVYALQFCHRRGVAHRDLKPENILLTGDGRVKLADFGMASLLTPGSLLETSCGTQNYCAPEVIRGELYRGPEADVWSLGVILYAMITGGLPFDDENFQRLVTKISSGAFYMPSEVSAEIAAVIHAMLVVDPAERITLDAIRQTAWFNSRPCPHRVFQDADEEPGVSRGPRPTPPVLDPEPAILRCLSDLGLGDDPTLRRRLGMARPCLERDVYHQLAAYGNVKLASRELHVEVPSSPTENKDLSADLSPDSLEQIGIEYPLASMPPPPPPPPPPTPPPKAGTRRSQHDSLEERKDSMWCPTPSWFPHWLAAAALRKPQVLQPHNSGEFLQPHHRSPSDLAVAALAIDDHTRI